jgi:hypothetical protein
MKKNKLLIFSSILIIITLFATAVTCNLCGVSMEIGETTEETETRAERTQQTTETIQAASQSTEAPVEDNNPPAIREIELMGMDVEFAASE